MKYSVCILYIYIYIYRERERHTRICIIYIYIYIYMYICNIVFFARRLGRRRGRAGGGRPRRLSAGKIVLHHSTANLPTNIVVFRGFASSIILG